jgi:orotate phosphoribosyltransferase
MAAAMAPVLIEDAIQAGISIFQAVQAARTAGSATIDAATWQTAINARNSTLTQLDKDIAAGK